jgi:sterol desaturase/sphingolipid hydroxylase (fatty acid hydroxylase superfamily)
MFESSHSYEVLAFFGSVVVFGVWEELRPARPVDRLAAIKTDVLSFLLALCLNRVCTHAVQSVISTTVPGFALAALHSIQSWPSVWKVLVALITVDFVLYWVHRAQHRWMWLWRTHAWHHSPTELYWFSGFRTSFLHSLIYNVPQATLPMLVFQLTPLEAGTAYAIGVLVQFWEHTNVSVDIGPLARFLVTPKYHRIHHAADEPHGKNLAPIFCVWDRLFGTYVDPDTMPEDFPVGLGAPIERTKMPRMLLGV